jgi:hypothetical protein
MTGNSKEIKKLKHRQVKTRERIERYQKRRKKDLYLLVTPIVIYILFNIYGSYIIFGNVFIFIAIGIGVIILVITLYLWAIRNAIRNREREIKIIRTKLYHLMKLDED